MKLLELGNEDVNLVEERTKTRYQNQGDQQQTTTKPLDFINSLPLGKFGPRVYVCWCGLQSTICGDQETFRSGTVALNRGKPVSLLPTRAIWRYFWLSQIEGGGCYWH